MKKMSCLTKKVTEDIGQFFNSEVPDIPEVIFKLEEIATNVGYYSLFFKEYISEEFSTSTEFSFSILTVLNYMTELGVSLEEALSELFQLPSNESVCVRCIETSSEDKKQASDKFNFLLIQKSLDKGVVDDSFDDRDYKEVSFDHSTNVDSEEDVYTFKESDMGGVELRVDQPVKRQGADHIKPFTFNPFDESPPVYLPDPVSSENLNSTMFFNPFSVRPINSDSKR